MAITDITLEYDGTEQRLKDWGFTEPVMTTTSQAKTVFTVRMPGADLTTDPAIPFEGEVIIRASLAGAKIFQGRQITDQRVAQPGASADLLTFADAWYDLENLPFQQVWKYYPFGGGAPTTKRFSRVNLFWDGSTGAAQTNGAQITEIIAYAISCGVNLQSGTIDPAFNLPVYPARSIMCSEAILMSLRACPDAATWIDYTTTPPTFNCQQRASLTPLTMPFAGTIGTVSHKSSRIIPRYDLQPNEVVIDYEKTNSVSTGGDTIVWKDFGTDAYPPGATGTALRSLVMPIDLQGSKTTKLVGTIVAATFDPSTKDWWKTKKKDLAEIADGGNVVGLSDPISYTVINDDTGAAVSLTDFPRELISGTVNPWMKIDPTHPVKTVRATLTGTFSWAEMDSSTGFIKQRGFNSHQVSVKVILTNSADGAQTYSTSSTEDTGESAPADLAQKIFESLAGPLASPTLQYEGSHEVVEAAVSQIVGPQNVLNLSGGAVAWETMNATIQSARHDFFNGRTEITIGPAKHIASGDLAQLLIWARFRLVWEDPIVQKNGQVSGAGGQTEVGKQSPRENTIEGLPQHQYHATTNALDEEVTTVIIHDAPNERIQMHVANNDDGTRADEGGGVDIRREHCMGTDSLMHILTIREVDICVSGTPMKMMVIGSEPF